MFIRDKKREKKKIEEGEGEEKGNPSDPSRLD